MVDRRLLNPPATAVATNLATPRLPPALEHWRIWLGLLPPDLVTPVGALLLRLHPLVGRLNSARQHDDTIQQGVGNIVRRGLYERMLISEWAVLDVEPQEFLRRVANQELLFTGPEPQARKSSHRCIALFDSGPQQIGEPRLAHLALFILLARRAEEAGAEFLWGILQAPGKLHGDSGLPGLQQLIKARSANLLDAEHIAQWDEFLATMSAGLRDCWQIGSGGHGVPTVARMSSRVGIDLPWLDDGLKVQLIQRHTTREVALTLPPEQIAIRLLRDPLQTLASPARQRDASAKPSLKQAPRLAVNGDWIALPLQDGSCRLYHIPRTSFESVGNPRDHQRPASGSVLSAHTFKKSFCQVIAIKDSLRFIGFPGTLGQRNNLIKRPPANEFHAPAGLARWLPLFYQSLRTIHQRTERILMLDTEQKLVCWQYSASNTEKNSVAPVFSIVASKVIGATQFGDTILYACQQGGTLSIHAWYASSEAPKHLYSLPLVGLRVLFDIFQRTMPGVTTNNIAVQLGPTEWLVGNQHEHQTIHTPPDVQVIAIHSAAWDEVTQARSSEGNALLVLSANKKSIQRISASGSVDVLNSPQAIAHALFDPVSKRLAWLTYTPTTLGVRKLGGSEALLHIGFGSEQAEEKPQSGAAHGT
jgi:hypothetical protein